MKSVVYLFPGQGSQKQGMLSELHSNHPVVRDTFAEASHVLGYSMEDLCFKDTSNQLSMTEYTQPALLTCSTAIWRLLQSKTSVHGPTVAGHSLGEYSALVAAGVLEFADALRLVRRRGQAMQQAVPVGVGAMAALMGEAVSQAESLCEEISEKGSVVEIANENSLTQVVVSGHKDAVERLSAAVKERKLGKAIALPVSAPFHSSLMYPAAQQMESALQEVPWGGKHSAAKVVAMSDATSDDTIYATIYANVDAKAYRADEYTRDLLVRQIASRVRWTLSLQNIVGGLMQANKEQLQELIFVEIGPGNVLQGLVKKTIAQDPEAHPRILTCGTDSVENLLQTIASIS